MTKMTMDEARASILATMKSLRAELAECETYLADGGDSSFTVAVQVNDSRPSGLRKHATGYNFNGTTPATIHRLSASLARLNADKLNAAAKADGKTDVKYEVWKVMALVEELRASKLSALEGFEEILAGKEA